MRIGYTRAQHGMTWSEDHAVAGSHEVNDLGGSGSHTKKLSRRSVKRYTLAYVERGLKLMDLVTRRPLIYDVGMNNGDDSAYYLSKGSDVVAIEADPRLCEFATRRFSDEIAAGVLVILNVGVGPQEGVLPFFVHKHNSVLSTFENPPQYDTLDAFEPISMKVQKLSQIVKQFGPPHYVKIDVEGFDAICLQDLGRAGIVPPYVSAEAHTIDTFHSLINMGYERFKMVCGTTVHVDFAMHQVETVAGNTITVSFPLHAAGPYGEDIPGDWVSPDEILQRWTHRASGWYDLHAKL